MRFCLKGSALFALAVLAAAGDAGAQAVTDPTKPAPPTPAPAPAASNAAPSPFTFTAAYTADLLDDASGGISPGGSYVDLLKLSAAYDGANAGHDGLTGLISIEHQFGSQFTAQRVGAIQAISASEAQPGTLRLYEAWGQQEVLSGQGGVKVGLIDLNSTFDVQETAALFLNASNGIGPDIGDTGLNGPSDYPTPALAVTSFYRPAEGWTAQVGVFDGVAGDPAHRGDFIALQVDGALIIGQIEKRFGDTARIEVGAWTYTAEFPSLDNIGPNGVGRSVGGNDGVYGLLEGQLMPKPGGGDGGLAGWIRAGFANGNINPIANYASTGLVYTGLIAGRDKDEIGVSIARAGLGSGARDQGHLEGRRIGAAETNLETTYRYVVSDWLNVQPDLQYVINPHGDVHIPDALVVGLRLSFTYTK